MFFVESMARSRLPIDVLCWYFPGPPTHYGGGVIRIRNLVWNADPQQLSSMTDCTHVEDLKYPTEILPPSKSLCRSSRGIVERPHAVVPS